MKKKMSFDLYKKINKNNLITKAYHVQLQNKEDFISYSRALFKLNKASKNGFRKLNREKDAKLFTENDNYIKIQKAEDKGFFRLECFADVYRRTIKISYGTLRTRITEKPVLLQYLIDNDYIALTTSKVGRMIIVVNFAKHFEFIELITKSFLSEEQRNAVIK